MAKESTPAMGEIIDRLYYIREDMKALNKELDELKAERDQLTQQAIEMMDAQGTDQTRSDLATASITETVVPQVEDWDKFYNFINRNKAFYLLERRPASAAYRDLLESRKGRAIPGVSSFTKRNISLRTR